MKHIYNNNSVLQTETQAHLEVNYNRSIFGMTKPGDPLFYKAPQDPAERPLYVDSEGRPVPVSPTTLQPMTNANGNIVDRNGNLITRTPVGKVQPHIDDVRIAITSADFDITDDKGDPILIAHDGEIIPTNDDGVPGTVIVDGEVWVVGSDGEPYAPLNRVWPINSYVNPVRAENILPSGVGEVEDIYEEYFPIDSISEAERPSERGVQVAWATPRGSAARINTGIRSYEKTRFYVASEKRPYKYWTSPTTSGATPTLQGATVSTFGTNWRVNRGSNRQTGTNMVAADFPNIDVTHQAYFEASVPLNSEFGYQVSFELIAQETAEVKVELLEWRGVQPDVPNHNSSARLRPRVLSSRIAIGGRSTPIVADVTPSDDTKHHAIRVTVYRRNAAIQPRITLTDLSLRRSTYPIENVNPRIVYDRPIRVNKIVVGVDYSVDESVNGGTSSHFNKPAQHTVGVYRDRGDGVFQWVNVNTNPSISESGHITLYWNGLIWTEEYNDQHFTTIMGVRYSVTGTKRMDARINIMEISARLVSDISDHVISYNVSSDAADASFVLPFGTLTSNTGSVDLYNGDGRFNPENRFLLNTERSVSEGKEVFTDEPNPYWQILNESARITIDTATFAPGSDERNWMRAVTARTNTEFLPSTDMTTSISFFDDAKLLDTIIPDQLLYTGNAMSLKQVLYMLLDAHGFTSVNFSDDDEHFSTHMQYFWVTEKSDSLWKIISDICRSTQTVGYFDSHNRLNFKSLRGMYEDALRGGADQVYTTEDLPSVIANIKDMRLTDTVAVNKVSLNYREITQPERTPSGDHPMTVVWQPEGTQVLRAEYLVNDLNDKQVGSGGTPFLQFRGSNTKTWPYSGMVQVEGELIKYNGKAYKYHISDGRTQETYIYSEEERQALDKRNEYLSLNNTFTGKLKIEERGAEGTEIKSHAKRNLNEFFTRFNNGGATTKHSYKKGLSIKNSRLFVVGQNGTAGHGTTTISTGNWYDDRPKYVGTRLRINEGAHAGLCFVGGTHDDGVYIEVTTTEQTEASGRVRGEIHCFVKRNGKVTFYGAGTHMPISKYRDYDVDVSLESSPVTSVNRDYSAYYDVMLEFGDRGAYVRVLQIALNEHLEKLTADGVFGDKTREAVRRFQKRKNLTRDGVVDIDDWKALEKGNYREDVLIVNTQVDGVTHDTTQIPYSALPPTIDEGRYGVFTRTKTSASFEYLYGAKGGQDWIFDFDDSNFFDFIKGGYVSNQLNARWIYRTAPRWVNIGGKRVLRDAVTRQLMMTDFGPYAHEVRDYEVVFEDAESPALASYLYCTNETGVHVVDYRHQPFGATFRLANKTRDTAVLNGEDLSTFGSENAVDQRMMVYGHTLKIEDERRIDVTNKTSTAARGVDELSIDVDWLQSKESAQKLGSHIVEAMSNPVPTYEVDVFGNASAHVGQTVSLYNPQIGLGDKDDPETANRYFVYGVNQRNDGAQMTTLTVREVIGSSGIRNATLKDIYARNNNAANMNWDMSKVKIIDGTPRQYAADGYTFRNGITPGYSVPIAGRTGGTALLTANGDTARNTMMLMTPFPDGVGRMPHRVGNYFLAYAHVTAHDDLGVQIAIEGHATSSQYIKDIAAQIRSFKKGQTRTIVVKGRYLDDGSIPEIWVGLRLLSPTNHANGAPAGAKVQVSEFYYRDSQNEEDIYPLRGGREFRRY